MKPGLGRAIIGGFVGTPAITVLMYTVTPFLLIHFPIALLIVRAGCESGRTTDEEPGNRFCCQIQFGSSRNRNSARPLTFCC